MPCETEAAGSIRRFEVVETLGASQAGLPEKLPEPWAPPGDLRPGGLVGNYELIRPIARGGMGVVWEARNTKNRLNLPVALKMIRAGEAATEADIQRFLVEARAVAALHGHTHIVKIYGIGTHGDRFYFAMQLIRGGSLKPRVAEYREDHRAAVGLMIDVAAAIGHARRRGILHRDLKPDNILIDESGHLFVTDFGLAKRVDPIAPSATIAASTNPEPAPTEPAAPRTPPEGGARAKSPPTPRPRGARSWGRPATCRRSRPGASSSRSRRSRTSTAWGPSCTSCWPASRRSWGPAPSTSSPRCSTGRFSPPASSTATWRRSA